MKGSIDCRVRSTAPPSACTDSAAALAISRVSAGSARSSLTARASDVLSLIGKRTARAVELGKDVGEVVNVGAVQDGGAELCRLDRVLSAVRHERAAHQDERRKAVEQPNLADRIRHVDIARPVRWNALRAAGGAQAGPLDDGGDLRPAMRVARSDDRQEVRMARRKRPVHGDDDIVLARMGAGRQPDRPAGDEPVELRQRAWIGGRRRRVEFQVARDRDLVRAEPREAFRIGRRLREAEGEAAEKRTDHPREALPAPERAIRHPAIDEDERDLPPIELDDRVRPDLRFRDERQIRLPMIEKAPDVARHVERHELVKGAGRQAAGDEGRRGSRAGGDEDEEAALRQSLDDGNERQRLADARAMHPDEMPGGSAAARMPAPFAEPRPLLAAPALAPIEEPDDRRFEQRDAGPVGADERGQAGRHTRSPWISRAEDFAASATPAFRFFAPGSRAPTSA